MEENNVKQIAAEVDKIYPVRYERRTAIAPVLWICGATFTTTLVWCTVNVCLTNDNKYIEKVFIFAMCIASIAFVVALVSVVACLIKDPDRLHTEHYLLQVMEMNMPIDSNITKDKDKDDGNQNKRRNKRNRNNEGNRNNETDNEENKTVVPDSI